MGSRRASISFSISLMLIILTIPDGNAIDTMDMAMPIRDGKTLLSSRGKFELGFFRPGSSNNRYVGIWYKKISLPTAVWVANREIPLVDSSGVLKITDPGILVLINGSGHVIWSTNSSRSTWVKNPVAQLLDSGNLVVREKNDENPDNFVWQSFDYPSDIHLPGMKLGWDLVTGIDSHITSWESSDDPSPGRYNYGIDHHGYPQLFLTTGSVVQCRFGPWNGVRFSGIPGMNANPIFTPWFVFNQNQTSYAYELHNSSMISHAVLNPYGQIQRVIWNNLTQEWDIYAAAPAGSCDTYAVCGAFGSCNIANSPECGCLKGFTPKSPKDWDSGDWSDGCVRVTQLNCKSGDGFTKNSNVKLPDTRHSWYNKSMTLNECQRLCLQDCNCTAYSNLDVRGEGSGCLLWFNDLIDIRIFDDFGQDLYVRMASSELAGKKQSQIIVSTVLTAVVLLSIAITLYFKKRRKKKGCDMVDNGNEESEFPLLVFTEIAQATGNFSDDNMLGKGGFGRVYKGILKGGQEIAVKRLSKESAQGLDEFKNEVICIAKLQHRNLVKLLGYCIQAEERMLIYEYMPNKSLDHFIFDQTMPLDWPKRFHILNGIARGILYLHQDSRLRIIHRDLKASNILLDHDLNPKISDFGMARCFDGNEFEANTRRVVGTYGYMSPEYVIDGIFSTKSDVFSFGVLVLEIVSGKRNTKFQHPDHHHNLLGHAWRLYKKGESLKLVDPSINLLNNISQILRSIHIGLLCVQQFPEDRPSMSVVVIMLSSDCELPHPKQPGFFIPRNLWQIDSILSKTESVNEITITLVAGR